MAPRIVLATLERVANKRGRYIEPLISFHIDFYVRVFVRVRTQAAEAKLAASKLANVFHCLECPAFHVKPVARVRLSRRARGETTQAPADGKSKKAQRTEMREVAANQGSKDADGEPSIDPVPYPEPIDRAQAMHCTSMPIEDVPRRCVVCGGRIAMAGPIYAAPSQNPSFIDKVLETMQRKGTEKLQAFARVQGLLQAARAELQWAPLFYKVPDFASTLRIPVPPFPIIVGALCRLGYECSQVHCEPAGLKTTAPPNVVASVLRTYRDRVQAKAAEEGEIPPLAALPERIRAPVIDDLDLSYDKQYDASSKATGIAKFIPNPSFWGPRARHCGVAGS